MTLPPITVPPTQLAPPTSRLPAPVQTVRSLLPTLVPMKVRRSRAMRALAALELGDMAGELLLLCVLGAMMSLMMRS